MAAPAESATGTRSGRSRAVSLETPGLTASPDALTERTGRNLMESGLPVPALGLAQEGSEDGGRNKQIRQLGLPMQHLISPVDNRTPDAPKYRDRDET